MAAKKSGSRNSGRSGGTRKSTKKSTTAKRKRSSSRGAASGMSSFYKMMLFLAVCGVAAALYFGGHLSALTGIISEAITAENLGGVFSGEDVSDSDASTTNAAPSATAATTTTSGTSASTSAATTSSAVSSTTSKTTTTKKTTTTTVADSGNNAKYVVSANYKSPYYIVVFTGSQSVVVYAKDSNGNYTVQKKCFTCSTGASSTPTRTGMYSILRSYRWRLLMGGVYGQYSSGISSSYLFHSVLYDKTDEGTLFENSYRNLGKAASHGCIRLCVRDAKWIYDNCPIGTQVHIVNASGPKGEPLPPLREGSIYRGWEPTDPNPNNPYNKPENSTTTTAETTSSTTTSTATTAATTTSVTTTASSTTSTTTVSTISSTTTTSAVAPTEDSTETVTTAAADG